MILKHRILEKYNSYTFSIPISNRDTINVKPGDELNTDTPIYTNFENKVRHAFYLPDQLGCPLQMCSDYVTCIDGEFVRLGDELAQRVARGGLVSKTLLSPANGIISLARIKMGYIDILGEEVQKNISGNFKGKVLEVNPVDGIKIETKALALDLLATSKLDSQNIFGTFTTLNTGKDIRLFADNENYEDKIVFVGKHLHVELLKDLFEKGAKFVLTYSMDYEDFKNQGLPIGILGGFGEIYSPQSLMDELYNLNDSFVIVDHEEQQLFFLSKKEDIARYSSSFVKTLRESKIISHALGNYGMAGTIVSEEDNGYVTVEWENSARSLAKIGTLEFVDFNI